MCLIKVSTAFMYNKVCEVFAIIFSIKDELIEYRIDYVN
jgi:hypothetical protein